MSDISDSTSCRVTGGQQRAAKAHGSVTGLPVEGVGGRVLRCEQYLECLRLAAAEDWDSFHFEECTNNGRFQIDFFPDDFEGLDDGAAIEGLAEDAVEIDLSILQPEIDVCLVYEDQKIEVCSGL